MTVIAFPVAAALISIEFSGLALCLGSVHVGVTPPSAESLSGPIQGFLRSALTENEMKIYFLESLPETQIHYLQNLHSDWLL